MMTSEQIRILVDKLDDLKKDVRNDIGDINTTVNAIAVSLGEVRGRTESIEHQVQQQGVQISSLSDRQVLSDSTLRRVIKSRDLKDSSDSIIPPSIKNNIPKKFLVYLIIGISVSLGVTGYLIFASLLNPNFSLKMLFS